ncbi:L-seryl-tRNA(Sec) selenium transferase [Carboxydothermus ferrireducens]|uniref:L-seryl-tRNA(Sec) selenium transferase n=1 Tax=Carboxydothermus ferrireducens DSM 11255 TaxID=1119529 RepID=A0ABX2RFG1_9THEO|nr:L-seryl-tRNA(Sec) selenium transferase [Carboxydothermus ferrireducens]NYE58553.1 L-seryl-tRNA(Ser) seleniumtransferase [Carboxydothermus ferrireducens DSM 11255]
MALEKLLRSIPKVDEILKAPELQDYLNRYQREIITRKVREVLDELRTGIVSGQRQKPLEFQEVVNLAQRKIESFFLPPYRRVVNGTGVVLHTNLGRAPLAPEAVEALRKVSGSYGNLELDLTTGKRGSRYDHVVEYLCELTGAEDALVVNNNASAVVLALSSMAFGKEVIVSRGQLVEIGGAFRIPEIMERSGAILKEVGTTNKTRLDDYRKAINENTGLLLGVHTSNYKIIGFTESVEIADLVKLGKEKGIPVMWDLGSGSLVDLTSYGLPYEPTVQEVLAAGVDVVTFSGDKLLGGPQAGIIAGKKEFVAKMKKHPLTRAIRIDKMTVAALQATLMLYFERDFLTKIPVLRMLTEPPEKIKKRAQKLYRKLLRAKLPAEISIGEGKSEVGGGAFPGTYLSSYVIKINPHHLSVEKLAKALREENPALLGRIEEEKFIIDLRTVLEEEIDYCKRLLEKHLVGDRQ